MANTLDLPKRGWEEQILSMATTEAIVGIMVGMLFLISAIRLFMMFGKIVANTQHTSRIT